jgi:hypothetical protein
MPSVRTSQTFRAGYNPRPAMRLSLVVLALGCSSRYFVRPAHLEQARAVQATGGGDVAIPAVDRDREPTFLRASTVRQTLGTDPYGLLEVSARDLRPGLRITGWIVGGMGAVLGLTASGTYSAGSDFDAVTTILLVQGVVLLAAGVPLLVLGYTIDGPESDRPSPGMPAAL